MNHVNYNHEDYSRPVQEVYPEAFGPSGRLKHAKYVDQATRNSVFIYRARQRHKNDYEYTKVVCGLTQQEKVTITCPLHGDFLQRPSDHISGKGCSSCGGGVKLTTETFTKLARTVHGDLYDYSKVDYKNFRDKIVIGCKIHGDFFQIPNDHTSKGAGCPRCAGVAKLTTREFIDNSKATHGDRYDYSKVQYLNCMTQVEILCKEHGSFFQTPNNHISKGHGCSQCAAGGEDTKLYLMKSSTAYKIGVSNNPALRAKYISKWVNDIELVAQTKILGFKLAHKLEQGLLKNFPEADNPYKGEEFSGHTEWRVLTPEQVEEVITKFNMERVDVQGI